MRLSSILALIGTFVLMTFSHATTAQQPGCPDAVNFALETTGNRCEATGRNEMCYGNIRAEARPRPDVRMSWQEVGDIVTVSAVEGVSVSAWDEATGDWGVVLMRLQANLPDTLPGQNVTMVLFGDVEITDANAVIDDPQAPPPTDNVHPMQAFYLNTGVGRPGCDAMPESGVLIQTPEGAGEVALTVNEVNIALGSTVFLQADRVNEENDEGELVISTLEGAAFVEREGEFQVSLPGTRLRVPIRWIGRRIQAIAGPNAPEAYDDFALARLPLRLLARRIQLHGPLTPQQLRRLNRRLQSGQVPCDEPGFPTCQQLQFILRLIACTQVVDGRRRLCESFVDRLREAGIQPPPGIRQTLAPILVRTPTPEPRRG